MFRVHPRRTPLQRLDIITASVVIVALVAISGYIMLGVGIDYYVSAPGTIERWEQEAAADLRQRITNGITLQGVSIDKPEPFSWQPESGWTVLEMYDGRTVHFRIMRLDDGSWNFAG